MSCPELPTDGPCEAVCARCGRDMHIDLRRLRLQIESLKRARRHLTTEVAVRDEQLRRLRKIEQRARRMSLQRETVDVAEYILYADDGEEA